jgi:hypothetical protein
MFTADSTSWFYLNILQSLLPAQERSPLTQTETLMSKLGREYELRSQLQEAVSFSIDSENRYNRAGLLSALAAIPFLDYSDRIRLLQRTRKHAELHGYAFISAVADFLLYQDPDYLQPLFFGPSLSRDERSRVLNYGMQDIGSLRGLTESWGNLLRLL